MRQVPGSMIGRKPTAAQKLTHVANQLGLPGIQKMQGSNVNLYDTVILNTSASARQTLSFFSSTAAKSRNFTNWQAGQFKAGESMVIETVSFLLLTLSASTLSSDGTTIDGMRPISQVDATQVGKKDALTLGLLGIKIANKTVLKDYLGFEQNPSYNPATATVSLGKILTSADAAQYPTEVIGRNSIEMEARPVIPPTTAFEITYEVPPVGTVTGTLAIMCVIGRFGSIFNANTNL